jgi:hypothetical protein
MNKFTKTLLATALLASAGVANAALVTDSSTGGNELFLQVWDPLVQTAPASGADPARFGRTLNVDLGVTWGQIATGGASALSTLNNLDLTSFGTAWSTFAAGITDPTQVKYVLATGSSVDWSIAVSGKTAITPNLDPTVTLANAAFRINQHANEIAPSLNASGTSIVNDFPATPFAGQMNHPGGPANELWTGWPYDPTQTLGSSVGFWLNGGNHVELIDDGIDIVPFQVFTAADIHKLGDFNLSTNGQLTFTAAAVPLPAAVWMFGAGLMGLLRVSRRKSVQV